MAKKSQALTPEQKTLPIAQIDNPWLEVAQEAGSDVGRLMKFVKGKWETGDDEVAEGTEFVAHVDQLMRGWVRFDDGKVTDRRIGKVADGFKPPPREELGDTDENKWKDKDADGHPKDPWTVQWFLPLIGVETGDVFTFVTSSKGGVGAIGDLCRVYGHKQRENLLPIVALKARSYKHPRYGRVETPDLAIVGWDGDVFNSGSGRAEAVFGRPYRNHPTADGGRAAALRGGAGRCRR
jgi:hypothetical protein